MLKFATLFARQGEGPGSVKSVLQFFKDGIGCPVVQLTEQWGRVETGATPIVVQGVDRQGGCLACHDRRVTLLSG
jgi:hypothetical protein